TTLLAGADFSYPDGKSYARGTYIYGYYGRLQRRLSPLESHFSGFVFKNSSVEREVDMDGEGRAYARYLTKPLMSYREHLERFAAASDMEILPLRGKGVELRIGRKGRPRAREPGLFAAGPAKGKAEAFLEGYVRSVRALPSPSDPSLRYLGRLKPEERDLWTTLLPAASAFQRANRTRGIGAADLLEMTRSWAIAAVEEALAAGP
ncbi:MAG TPA: hypothetical protein VFL04_04775, partial [Rectinemataceae bacterium]|nr:hypothetical protein [Rectinemataceae bacterium]